jgi:hypothetical protein
MDSLLINKDDFINWTELSPNINKDKLNPLIIDAQIRLVAPAICDSVYQEILSEFDSDTLTPDNETLLEDYIKPFLVMASYVNYLVTAGKYSTKTGMVKIVGDGKEQITREELKDIIKDYKSKRDFYKNRVINFLECNTDVYPLFKNCCHPKKSNFSITAIESPQRRYYKQLDKYFTQDRHDYYDDYL